MHNKDTVLLVHDQTTNLTPMVGNLLKEVADNLKVVDNLKAAVANKNLLVVDNLITHQPMLHKAALRSSSVLP